MAKKEAKKSIFERFMLFINGVKAEFKRVCWPTRKDMVKYSIATVVFVLFCSAFFYIIDILFALVHTLFN